MGTGRCTTSTASGGRYETKERAGLVGDAQRSRWRIEKAERFLRAAESALASDDWETAVSRAYYAVFHAVIAVLETRARIRRARWDHDEVQAQFRVQFARQGFLFNIRDAEDFEAMYRARLVADYQSTPLTPRIVTTQVRYARRLLEKIVEAVTDA